MKKKIRIFIAGPKSLEGERNALKALAHDLNSGYEAKRARINIQIRSYDNFKNNQNEYNQFIEQEADLVVFVLEGKPGEKTREEFVKAASSYKNRQRPEIILFIQEIAYYNKEVMQDIDDMVKPYLGDHYSEEYKDYDNLKAKTKQKIDQFVTPTFNLMQTIHQWAISILSVLCILFASLFVWANFFKTPSASVQASHVRSVKLDSVPILFAGGGSAANYIKEEFSLDSTKKVDVANYPNAIFANMPSGNAWRLLSEEYNRYKINRKKGMDLTFVTVCLSASRAPKGEFTKSCDPNEFYKTASVVECYLGEDPLIAYVRKEGSEEILKQEWIDNLQITPKDLASLIKRIDVFNVFITSPNSGTCNTYEEILRPDVISFENQIKNKRAWSYNEASDIEVFRGESTREPEKPYIILGSKNYYSLALYDPQKSDKEQNYYQFEIYDKMTKKPYTKPIYLYFMAIKDETDLQSAVIPNPIYEFLKKTKITNIDGWKKMVEENVVEESGKKVSRYLIKPRSNLIKLTKSPDDEE